VRSIAFSIGLRTQEVCHAATADRHVAVRNGSHGVPGETLGELVAVDAGAAGDRVDR